MRATARQGQPRPWERKQPQLWREDKSGTIRQKALQTQDAPEASRLRGAGERRGRPDLESHSVFDLKAWRELGRGRSSGCFCLETKSKSLGQWSQFLFHIFVFLFFFLTYLCSQLNPGVIFLCVLK